MDEKFSILFDDKPAFDSLDRLEKKLTQTGEVAEQTGNSIAESFDDATKQINEFDEAISDASKSTSEQAKQVNNAQKANQNWLASIKQTIAGQQIGGKTLAEWGDQAKAFSEKINLSGKAMQGASIAGRVLGGALKLIGIGALIGLVASAINYFRRFQSGVDKVAQVMAAVNAVIDKAITGFLNLGAGIGKILGGMAVLATGSSAGFAIMKEGADQALGSVNTLTVGLFDAAKTAAQLEAAFQALRETTIAVSLENAKNRVELEKQKAIADDTTKSFRERINAQIQAGKLAKDAAEGTLAIASEELRLSKLKFQENKENAEAKERQEKAEKGFFDALIERNSAISESEQKLRELRKEASEEQQKRAEARKKALEDERKLLEGLAKDLQKLRLAALGDGLDAEIFQVNQKFDELAKVAENGVEKLNAIEAKRGLSPEELAQRAEFQQLAVQIEEQRLGALLDVITEFNEKEIAIADEQEKRKQALAEKDLERAIKALEAEKKLRDEQINLTEQQNKKYLLELAAKGEDEKKIKEAEAELDTFIQAARLNNELEFQQNLLALTDKGNTEQVAQIEATIATIQAKIKNLQIDPAKKKGKGIFGLLGIDDENAQQAIKDATAQLIDAINQVSQARIDAAAKEVELLDEKISKQEEAVQREAEIAKEGQANFLKEEKDKLAELKKQRDAAAKEEAKARRAQILLDSVSQLSSLITASANIFKSLSGLPFGAGVPIAIALIAGMFGAFVAAKARALKAAEPPKLRKGARLEGRTHEQGGTPLTDSDGIVFAEAEKGEWLIGTGPSKEHDQFLERVNKGEFKGVNLNALLPKNYRNPASEAAVRIRDIESRKADISQDQQWRAMKAAYMEGSAQIVQAIKEQPEILPFLGGYKKVVKKGNITEIETVIPKN